MGAVRYLLDTHTFLWAATNDRKISDLAKKAIDDVDAEVYISSVTAYEVMNKYRIGKLPEYAYVAENFFEAYEYLDAHKLPIDEKHAHFAGMFEWSHRDPFDRLLAAQASVEDMVLITNDPAFESLPWVKILW